MAAPETHPLEHVVAIRRLLEHYEEGFAFIKELVQNADDALKDSPESGRLHLQWYKPPINSPFENPLLRGPALVVINDGPFTKRDRDGLMRMGMGSKAGDNERIGRFGLGMKAVFHVSEAFFFLESGGDKHLRELFCPWLPPQYEKWQITDNHQDWDHLSGVVKGIVPEFKKWFAVWIPLRRKDLVTNGNPIVRGAYAYPGDSAVCPETLIRAINHQKPGLGETLIFLKSLQKVGFHDGNRSFDFEHDHETKSLSPGTRYYRIDAASNDTVADAWKAKTAWPKVFELSETGERSVPDKAKWEASIAVAVSKCLKPTGGAIRLFWNVFLPVGNRPQFEENLPALERDLHLFLHGYFFLSEDRTTVYGAGDGFIDPSEDDQKGIKIAWNKALATSANGLLPLVPNALQNCFAGENFTDEQINAIISCLEKSEWFKTYRQPICHKYSLARDLEVATWKWRMFKSTKATLVFPKFDDSEVTDSERIVALLLGNRNLDRIILIESTAALAPSDLKVDWTEGDLKCLCDSVQREVLQTNPKARKYFSRFLTRLGQVATGNPEIWNDLPIYEVEQLAGVKSVVSAKALQDYADKAILFSNGDSELKTCLKAACPNVKAWFVVGTNPPGVSASEFNQVAVARLILTHETLGASGHRSALIEKLLSGTSNPPVKSAIRYLVHGSFACRNADGALFLSIAGNDPASKWNEVIKTVLELRRESWRLVDAVFATGINDQQKEPLCLKMCGADAFRRLLNEAGEAVGEFSLHPFHDFLLKNLKGTDFDPDSDNKLLRRLKIHCFGEDLFTSVAESVWLAPELGTPLPNDLSQIWEKLCTNAKIVRRSKDKEVVLRQEELFKERLLNPNGIIRLACHQDRPQDFAKLIVYHLGPLGTPEKATSDCLKKASWLPLNDGLTTTLSNLLWLEGADDQLGNFTRYRVEDSFAVIRSEIALDLAEAWTALKHSRPNEDEILGLLKTAFGRNPKLHFGLPKLSGPDGLRAWLKAMDGCEADISPAVPIIRALWSAEQGAEAEAKRTWAGKVAAVFAGEWSGDLATRYDTALEALRNRHEEADAETRDVIIRVFHDYLAAAVRAGRWETFQREDDFRLLNEKDEWKPLSELVRPCMGIISEFQVHREAAHALAFPSEQAGEPDAAVEVEAAEGDVESAVMLADFTREIPQLHKKQWGAFVCLLGDDAAIRKLADQLTEDTEGFRSGLFADDDLLRVIGQKHFRCTRIDGETIEMDTLNGSVLKVPIDSESGSFLVPDRSGNLVGWEISQGLHLHRIRLLSASRFVSFDAIELQRRVEQSITGVLRNAFRCEPSGVGEFLDKVIEVQERSLGVAQQTILLGAELHLQQLGWRQLGSDELKRALELLDDSKAAEAQAREQERVGHARGIEIKKNRENAQQLRNEGIRMLENLFKDNTKVQQGLATAMQRKIEGQGYRAESIPFEIFQNADDALSERSDGSDSPAIFVAEFNGNTVRFAHWGRPINDPASANDSIAQSYRQDLVKMILLNGSDKLFEAVPVTGKFGLGFKSIFLVCQTPRIISRSLAFEVLGATYPRRLHTEDESPIRHWLEYQCPARRDGTALELSLRPSCSPMKYSFCKLASYLPVFARCIHEIRVLGDEPGTYRWQPDPVQAGEGWELCRGDAGAVGRLIHLKCGDVSWLFGFDQNGVRQLTGIPCIWATAPLHSTDEVGFAINGPFDPDPGRTELGKGEAAEKRNGELFQQASSGLGQFLTWCAAHENICEALGINPDSPHSFWSSWWDLFSGLSTSNTDALAKAKIATTVWPKDADNGYSGVVKTFRIIPNGLPGRFEALTSINEVRFETFGYLASSFGQTLLSTVAGWGEWRGMEADLQMTAANIVSGAVAGVLKRQIANFKTELFTVPFLIRRLVGADGRVTSELSNLLGQYLNANLWESGYDWPQQERQDLNDFLRDLQFQNELAAWVTPTGLLISHGSGIEAGRAAFAPAGRRLDQQYFTDESLHFFRLCRGDMRVTPDEIAGWIAQALIENDEERVAASLRFLASTNDDCASKAAGLVSEKSRLALLDHAAFHQLTPEDQNRVKGAFQQAEMNKARLEGRLYAPEGTFERDFDNLEKGGEDKSITIQDLIVAWNGNEQAAIQQFTVSGIYRALVFPDVAGDGDLGSLLRDTDSIEGKQHWYRLLCLGCSMSITLGRNPGARIIPFWHDRLNAAFWAATTPQTLDEAKTSGFDQRLDAFFEAIIHQPFRNENAAGEDADFWRRVFYDFRKMHFYVFKNDLPAVLLQLAIAKDVEGAALISFMRSGEIPPAMQTPDVPNWTGVIGQSMSGPLLFVMRELRRLKVLPPDRFDKACFYMNSPAQRVAYRMGWITDEDRRDYSFGNLVSLSESIFDRISESEHVDELLPFFDLPLQWYAQQNPG